MLKQTYTASKGAVPRISTASRLNNTFRDFKLPLSAFQQTIEEFFIALDTPIALSCLILYRHGEFKQLVEKELRPSDYLDGFRFRDDFAAVSLLRKSKFLETGIDKRAVALTAFHAAEAACKVTNKRFSDLTFDPQFKGSNVWLLNATVRKIAEILKNFNVDELLDGASWGPGVTTLVKGTDVSAPRKFREESGITSSACRLFGNVLPYAYPLWFTEEKLQALTLQAGNQLITVPKTAKTDRTIAIEPGINSWFQLGMGRLIRHRLGRAGFNLNSDEKNRSGARKGSLTGSLATVDFTAASDTISYNIVRELLPPIWFSVLDSLRSPCYNFEGTITTYEKFSAMGNGFTFELESLIFVASALACCEYLGLPTSDVSVFGDDIIIPSEAFECYDAFCTFLGFTVNPRKSFYDGYFRESCGGYYFKGVDCKPLFLKEPVVGASSTFRLLNTLRLFAHYRNASFGCDAKFLPVWRFLRRSLPALLRVGGPRSAGDACIQVNFDEGTPSVPRDQWCGFLHAGFLTSAVSREDSSLGMLNTRLWRPSVDRGYANTFDLRSVTKVRYKKRIFAPRWYNWGPWF